MKAHVTRLRPFWGPLFIVATLTIFPVAAQVTKPDAASSQKSESVTSSADEAIFDDSFGKLPTNISADNLTLHQKNRVFVYKGNVIVTQGDMTLTSKALEGTYSEDNQIQRLVAKGDVVITKKEIRATSQQALYDAATATVTLIDTPQLQQNDSILTADKIKVFLNENRSQAEGAVRVTIANQKEGGATLPVQAKKEPAKEPGKKQG